MLFIYQVSKNMENEDLRKEIEDMFEVCPIAEFCCKERDVQVKKVQNVSYILCLTCAKVIPEGTKI